MHLLDRLYSCQHQGGIGITLPNLVEFFSQPMVISFSSLHSTGRVNKHRRVTRHGRVTEPRSIVYTEDGMRYEISLKEINMYDISVYDMSV